MKHKIYQKVVSLLGSRNFFYFLVAFFILQAIWIALSGRYPMAFDEDFHLGIIKLYSHQWSPFFAHQPANGNEFGALTRDPSYMYHYLMSFPYRLANVLFHSEFINIIVLRFIDISFVTAGMLVFRRVLSYTKASPRLINIVFLFFVLTPLVTFEAAQINYDNLLIPLVALSLLGSIRFVSDLKRTKRCNSTLILGVLAICMFSSLVKYSFLPLFVVILLYLLGNIFYFYRVHGHPWINIWRDIVEDFTRYSKTTRLITLVLIAVTTGLFVQMYGYNLIKYREPVPDCDQIMSVRECKSYGVWNRNYTLAQNKGTVDANPIAYTKNWASTYFCSFLFIVNGSFSGFLLIKSPPIIYWTALTVFYTGTILIIIFARRIFSDHVTRFLGALILGLLLALWVDNYLAYLRLGQPFAEQGRYLLVLLLPIYCIVAMAFKQLLASYSYLQFTLFIIILMLFLQGGGITTYIDRTDSSWWHDNQLSIKLNESAKKVVKPFIIGG